MPPPLEIADSEDESDGDGFDYDGHETHEARDAYAHDLPGTLDPLAPSSLLQTPTEPNTPATTTAVAIGTTIEGSDGTTTATRSTDSTDPVYFQTVYDAQNEAARRHAELARQGHGGRGGHDGSSEPQSTVPATDPGVQDDAAVDNGPTRTQGRRDLWEMPSSPDVLSNDMPAANNRTKRKSDGLTSPSAQTSKRARKVVTSVPPNTQQTADSVDLVSYPSEDGQQGQHGQGQRSFDLDPEGGYPPTAPWGPPPATAAELVGMGVQLDSMTRSQRRQYLSMMEASQKELGGGRLPSSGRYKSSGTTTVPNTPQGPPSSSFGLQNLPVADGLHEAPPPLEGVPEVRLEGQESSPPPTALSTRAKRSGRRKGIMGETSEDASSVAATPAVVLVEKDATDEEAPKRRRGRPKKLPSTDGITADGDLVTTMEDSHVPGGEEQRTIHEDVGPLQKKKKRGRPKRAEPVQQEEFFPAPEAEAEAEAEVEADPDPDPDPEPEPEREAEPEPINTSPPPKTTRRQGRPKKIAAKPIEILDSDDDEDLEDLDDDDDDITDKANTIGAHLTEADDGVVAKKAVSRDRPSRASKKEVSPDETAAPQATKSPPSSSSSTSKKKAPKSKTKLKSLNKKESPPSPSPPPPPQPAEAPAEPDRKNADTDGSSGDGGKAAETKAEIETKAVVDVPKKKTAPATTTTAARPIYRVGLSKKSRVAPLLKIVRK